jgi:hypothetical protein
LEENTMLKRIVNRPARLALSVLAAATVLVPVAPAAAQQAPGQGQQREHVVRRGDTLWDLARLYLSNPFLWPSIWEANQDVVRDPHRIFPSDRLIIPPVLQRPAPVEPGLEPVAPVIEPPAVEPPTIPTEAPTTISTLDMRRPVVPAAEFVRLPWVSAAADPGTVGRVLARAGGTARTGRMTPSLYPHEQVDLAMSQPVAVGDTLLLVRPGRRIRAGGTVIQPLALVLVERVHEAGVLGRIVDQFGDARVGDLLVRPQALPEPPAGNAEAVAHGPEGSILEFAERRSLYGTTDLAFVSLGSNHGIGIGDELAVYVPAGRGAAAMEAGVLRVVRVDETTSTARVVSVTGLGLGNGLPLRLVRRMP